MAAWAAQGFPNTETFTSTLKKKREKIKKKKGDSFCKAQQFCTKGQPHACPSPTAATHSGTIVPVSCIYEHFIY